ncbi:RluA family pseudouridine synthase [Geovibrio thiophilus]|uniref:RluA family pseudouridine synthase n=1 Tax=Geovibrio thiophilus TaxID=139438 RepID=A0A3R5UY22_9BACT|nr:RluA family pseudouridine synthase [Geovibrio thiophilus]QAR32582.1 RluA family pseudouridine synthase [Geovibrio thiophilus]
MKLDILYSDNHVLAVNKPAGLSTQVSNEHKESLEEYAREWVKREFGKPGNVFLHTVHRLDRPVSGVVLFARTDKALSRLNASMREKKAEKIYFAVIQGNPPYESGTLVHHHSHGNFKAKITQNPHKDSKIAVLEYERTAKMNGLSLLRIRLETGRYHQIRAQLAFIGSPIAGDTKYGSKIKSENDSIALHHREMSFAHPTLGTEISVTADIPSFYPWNILRESLRL